MAATSSETEPGVLRVLQTKDEIRSYYNKIAKVYDLLSEHSEQPMRELALAKLAPKAGESILEIGFGTGHTVVELAEAVGPQGTIYGIDISDAMVEATQKLMDERGFAARAKLERGDATELPYGDASLDGVFMSFTLELFDTPAIPQVLAECRRVLKPGGRIAVAGVSREGHPSLMVKAFEWTHKHIPNLMDCRPIYIRRAIEAAGFRIADSTVEHMWVPVEIVLGVKEA
jgi:demethylmenaquinone methyltransferase/2-methoxy-6-polyprenyl-1,4-benzoquinol methylase